MKKPASVTQPTDLLWDDLVKNCLQFASKKEGAATDDRGHILRFSTPTRLKDHVFDIAVKSK